MTRNPTIAKKAEQSQEFCPGCGQRLDLSETVLMLQRVAYHPLCSPNSTKNLPEVTLENFVERGAQGVLALIHTFAASAGDTITDGEAIGAIRGLLGIKD